MVSVALPRLATRARITQDPNLRGVGATGSKFLYPPPATATAAGPRRPPSHPRSQRPLHLGRAPRPLSQLCSSPRRLESGRSGRRREVAREGGCWDRAAGLRADTWGRRGRRRRKGGGPAVLGAPPASPGEAGTSLGSRRPRTGHGEERSHLPGQPLAPGRGRSLQCLSGSQSERCAPALCVTLARFCLGLYGRAGVSAEAGRPHRTPRPSVSPTLPHPGRLRCVVAALQY